MPPSMPASPEPGSPAAADHKRLQMADIARLAGVSVSTVSRALNGSTLVSEATRLRVAELARSLNDSINLSAQNLRLKKNQTIAVVLPFDAPGLVARWGCGRGGQYAAGAAGALRADGRAGGASRRPGMRQPGAGPDPIGVGCPVGRQAPR